MTNLSLFNKNIKKKNTKTVRKSTRVEKKKKKKKNANELNRIFQIPILKART